MLYESALNEAAKELCRYTVSAYSEHYQRIAINRSFCIKMEAHKHVAASQGWYRRVGPIKLQTHVQSAIPIQDPEVHRQMTGYLQ